MIKFLSGVAVSAMSAATLIFATGFSPIDDLAVKQRQMLNPTVRVEFSKGVGSGTIVHSGADGTYILTNEHVIETDIIKNNDDGSPLTNEKGERYFIDYTQVGFKISGWIVTGGREHAWPVKTVANIVAFDKEHDLALLKVNDDDFQTDYVAKILSQDDKVRQMEPVYVAGSPLGARTLLTEGMLSLKDLGENNNHMMMISAPITHGNSGGAVYVKRGTDYVMAAIPDALPTENGVNWGMVIPMTTVRNFLAHIGKSDLIK